MRHALADAIVGGDECPLRMHAQLDSGGKHSHIGKQWREQRIRQVLDGFEVAAGDKQAVAGKQGPMVKKSDGVLVLENAKYVFIAHNFAEGAARVKDAGLQAHVPPEPNALHEERVRPAQKTRDPSIWECRGSSIRGRCGGVRWYSPRHLYSWSLLRHPGDRQLSYHG